MRDATRATATFLFTDIEASTQLLRSHRDQYAGILADHNRLLRERFAAHGGREIDNQGDAFFVAFARAKDAVLAAAASQRALVEHSWPGGASVRVRMGIHTGEADLTVDRYVGLSVHRAARISAMGHGGQVLVSETTASLLDDEDQLPGIALRYLGEHRLKDISRPVRIYQLDISGLRKTFPRLHLSEPRRPDRRKRAAFVAAGLLLAVLTTVALAVVIRDEPPPTVLPNSLVRVDPATLEPTQVVRIGSAPDLVLSAGGFIWMTHHVLRDTPSAALRDAGDRTLTRVDPTTSEVVVVGGGLAPCGLTADPSGDVWVANCFASGADVATNVVRIDATTLRFEATWSVPGGDGFYRGLAYGGGSLWVSEISGLPPPESHSVTQVDPLTGDLRSIALADGAAALAWSEGYGDLWISNFNVGSVSRMHTSTGTLETVDAVVRNPAEIAIDGEGVWVADWALANVARLDAVAPTEPRLVSLPTRNRSAGVWSVATGHGSVWATTPRDGALWRIDPGTHDVVRVTLPHQPTGVTADAAGVWVTVRGD